VPKVLRAKDLPTVPLKDWKDIGDHAANKVREYVRGGILKGKYSKDYAEAKASRKAGPKGASISSIYFIHANIIRGSNADGQDVRRTQADEGWQRFCTDRTLGRECVKSRIKRKARI